MKISIGYWKHSAYFFNRFLENILKKFIENYDKNQKTLINLEVVKKEISVKFKIKFDDIIRNNVEKI